MNKSTIPSHLPRIEFYITNVCNLNCDNCNRLNNYSFTGHQLWKDYADIYTSWAEKVTFDSISILGGEPTLNPSLLEWIKGLRKLWPDSELRITTNGTRLPFIWNTLYPVLLEYNASVSITTHNRDRHKEIEEYLLNSEIFLYPFKYKFDSNQTEWVNAYNICKSESWPTVSSIDDFQNLPLDIQEECTNVHHIDPFTFLKNSGNYSITDNNGVSISFGYAENFVTAPLRYAGDNVFQVYDSDPNEAHSACISKHCHNFIKGKLYKCHHVGLLPDFMNQFQVNITDEDRQLLLSYDPLTPDQDQDTINKFISNMESKIPQCKLCPSVLENNYFQSGTKKIKIIKKQNN